MMDQEILLRLMDMAARLAAPLAQTNNAPTTEEQKVEAALICYDRTFEALVHRFKGWTCLIS